MKKAKQQKQNEPLLVPDEAVVRLHTVNQVHLDYHQEEGVFRVSHENDHISDEDDEDTLNKVEFSVAGDAERYWGALLIYSEIKNLIGDRLGSPLSSRAGIFEIEGRIMNDVVSGRVTRRADHI